MKLTSVILLFLWAFESSAANTKSVANKLASYPEFYAFDGHPTEKCGSVTGAAEIVGDLKKEVSSLSEAKAMIVNSIKNGEGPAELEEPFLYIVELAYTPEHAEKSADKFVEDIEHICKMPEVRICDAEINSAVYVSELKATGKSNIALTRESFREKGFSRLHFELLDMLFWPEHKDKSTQEFADFVGNEWCAKYSKRERTQLYEKREEELGQLLK